MAKVENIGALTAALARLARKAKPASCLVGYTQSYAVYVHENLQASHPVGQAKFLEEPARVFSDRIAAIIREAYRRTADMGKALLLGGLYLQRESQQRCPVDTGALRASAFTRLETGRE